MIRAIASIPYHFKSAVKSLTRNIAMSISSASAVMITLVLISLFLIIAGNVQSMTTNVESSVQIFVQIDPIVEGDEYKDLQKEIEDIDHVKKVTYSSSEEQFDIFINSTDGGEEYEMFRDDNPLTAAFYVEADKGENVESISNKIEKLDGVMSSSFGGSNATKMLDAFNSIKVGGSVLVVLLCALAVFLISNTIKITIQARSEEIAIMRFVGADNTFIKMPFMIEGMLIGLIGSIIPIILTIFAYGYLYDMMGGKLFSSLFKMQPPLPFVIYLSIALALLGAVVGIIGSAFSVSKYLKFKR